MAEITFQEGSELEDLYNLVYGWEFVGGHCLRWEP